MKKWFACILLIIPVIVFAQTVKKHKTTVSKNNFTQYYLSNSLNPDSAVTPYLYYQIYDWVGTRYKYSGESQRGIDCSGFTAEMYKNVYCINLPESSRSMWPVTTRIEKNNLKEGDLVFFKIRKGQISHVGIFLGNNKFAHASVKAGVIISDLNEPYYKKYYFNAGRVLND